MSKALAVLFTGAGASTVAVGGVALSNGLAKGKSDAPKEDSKLEKAETLNVPSQSPQSPVPARTEPKPATGAEETGQVKGDSVQEVKTPSQATITTPTSTSKLSAELSFKNLDEFRNGLGGECTKKYFGDLDFSKNDITKIDKTANPITPTYFSSTSNDANSCLVVNWDRTDSSSSEDEDNNRWKGNFKWLWAFAKGNKGFVMFTTTKEKTTASQLDLDGGIYFVEKDSTDKWSIKNKKELENDSQKMEGSTFTNLFPVKGGAITDLINVVNDNEDNWGFVKDASDLSNLCSTSEGNCLGETSITKKFRGSWIWKSSSSGEHTPDKWTKNLKDHLDKMYDAGSLSLEGIFINLKGSWSNENMSVSNLVNYG